MGRGFFINTISSISHNRIDKGIYFEERVVTDNLKDAWENGKGFDVEVYPAFEGVFCQVYRGSEVNRSRLESKLERRRGESGGMFLLESEDPVFPAEYSNSDTAIELYAEYTMRHNCLEGIEMDIDREILFDDENLSPI